jgi:hypothetical protein
MPNRIDDECLTHVSVNIRKSVAVDVPVHQDLWGEPIDQSVKALEPMVRRIRLVSDTKWGSVCRDYVDPFSVEGLLDAASYLQTKSAPSHLGLRVLVWARPVSNRAAEAGHA